MSKTIPEVTYAFIDSQNLNLGIRASGWRIDHNKFRLYLKNKYNVAKAYLFIGYVEGNEDLYNNLQEAGFIVVLKQTTEYQVDGKATVKGNVDAELVLYAAAKTYNKYDQAIIVSGDGDFACLVEYLEEKGKMGKLLVPNKNYSSLLRKYNDRIVRVDLLKRSLQLKTTKISGRSKP
jgi:uncharacterized LabA/DUF88 family protein